MPQVLSKIPLLWPLSLCWLLLSSTGCWMEGGSSESATFLIPWPEKPGHHTLQKVTLTTLSDPYELKGDAAEVYYASIPTNEGFLGEVAHPKLIYSDGVFIPADEASLLAVTTYAHYEHLMSLDKAVGSDSRISWPRKISVDSVMFGEHQQLITSNAEYLGGYDITRVAPYTGQALPIAINGGILAHEHFHAHFDAAVIAPIRRRFAANAHQQRPSPLTAFFQFQPDPQDYLGVGFYRPSYLPTENDNILEYNIHVLRAWDEGLADFNGYVYSKDPDFITESFPKGVGSRSLKGIAGMLPNIAEFSQLVLGEGEGASFGCKGTCQSYFYGSQLARFLLAYQQVSGIGLEEFVSQISRQLEKLGHAVAEELIADKKLPLHFLWSVLLSNESGLKTAKACALAESHFGGLSHNSELGRSWEELCVW